MQGLYTTTVLAAALLMEAAGPAIIIRHDRPDARYLELGARYPAVGRVGRRMGDGTLIGERHVLTAAHVARGLMRRGEPVVVFGERSYRVRAAFVHPEWVDMGPHDVAVLELAEPVRGITPLGLYAGSDERGQVATIVGHGRTGTGASRERRDDDRKRGATNRIDDAGPLMIIFRFDAPPDGTDLEGIPGAGDSGGPALLVRDGVALVAGVSSAGEPGADGPGSYGARDYFTRVSTHLAWIRDAVAGRAQPMGTPGEAAAGERAVTVAPGAAEGAAALPDTPAGRRLRALADLLTRGDTAAIDAFVREHVSSELIARRSLDDLRATYRRLMGRFRGGVVVRALRSEATAVDALIRVGGADLILGIVVDPAQGHRIAGVLEGRL